MNAKQNFRYVRYLLYNENKHVAWNVWIKLNPATAGFIYKCVTSVQREGNILFKPEGEAQGFKFIYNWTQVFMHYNWARETNNQYEEK